ncbi:MAG: dipicolinate synthase subunit DpsA [Oscillospiraceae bacterium]|nr:dipicolinate synthase subunit DpsA [Oscillospiraceae bacterium]
MKNDIKIGVVGGDLRQLVAAQELAEEGYEVAVYGFEEYTGSFGMATRCVSVEDAIRKADFIVLPLPYSNDKIHLNMPLSQSEIHLEDIFALIEQRQIVVGGRFDSVAENLAAEKKLKLIDYYGREDFTVLNAIPTAEGAINIAMQELPVTVSNSKSLIIGFGRIGKILAHKLYGLNTEVYVAARRYEDFAWIEAFGYKGVGYDVLEEYLEKFDVVFNTVPALMLDEKRLKKLRPDAIIIDLASNPGGIDFTAAKTLGRNVIWALSLPGKYAPITAGKILAKTIRIIMRETMLNIAMQI